MSPLVTNLRPEIAEAKRILLAEAQAISNYANHLGDDFLCAVELMSSCKGKVVVSGQGKSGHVARKISSTLASTGTPSHFMHLGEAIHGDLGMLTSQDLVVAISYTGVAYELELLVDFVKRKQIKLIAITGNPQSLLAEKSDVVLKVTVSEEACHLKLAPTTSSSLCLAIGDALALTLSKFRDFKDTDFAEYHPGGSLGRRLLTRVDDIMHKGASMPLVKQEQSVAELVGLMTHREVRGVCGVVGEDGQLVGTVTDGDIRRSIDSANFHMGISAVELMSMRPKTIRLGELASKALFMMEEFKIQTLFVVTGSGERPLTPLGLIHLQDLLRAGI